MKRIKSLWSLVTNRLTRRQIVAAVLLAALVFVAAVLLIFLSLNKSDSGRIVVFYDDGAEKVIVTHAETVAEALRDGELAVGYYDSIDPQPDTKITDSMTFVNIRRARMVAMVESAASQSSPETESDQELRVITPAGSASEIMAAVGLKLYPEDKVEQRPTQTFLDQDGAALEMRITRAKLVNLTLYGQPLTLRTQTETVAELLKEKNIELAPDDTLSVDLHAAILDQMSFQIWRNGIQTISVEEEIPFEIQKKPDHTKFVGFREVVEAGQIGAKSVVYEIQIQDGVEISRTKISEVITTSPVTQVEIIGAKSTGGLTKNMGVNTFVDSNGVAHRETYYDLPMNVVMRNCGQGGYYTVRDDGVKIDRDGYVIIAANLQRYPRCSVVETSLGLGKVYDTGGFAARHPDGWDIATDWTNWNGI